MCWFLQVLPPFSVTVRFPVVSPTDSLQFPWCEIRMGAPTKGCQCWRYHLSPLLGSLFSLKELEAERRPLPVVWLCAGLRKGESGQHVANSVPFRCSLPWSLWCRGVLQLLSHVLGFSRGVLCLNSCYLFLWRRSKSGTSYFTMLVMSLPLIFLVILWEVKKFLTLIRCNLSNFLYIISAFCALYKKFFAYLR